MYRTYVVWEGEHADSENGGAPDREVVRGAAGEGAREGQNGIFHPEACRASV
jgi:hypothetical protein